MSGETVCRLTVCEAELSAGPYLRHSEVSQVLLFGMFFISRPEREQNSRGVGRVLREKKKKITKCIVDFGWTESFCSVVVVFLFLILVMLRADSVVPSTG